MQLIKKMFATRGKDKFYLLGTNKERYRVWLQGASWDCGWYWGFGYLETFVNNRSPEIAIDISFHTHVDGTFWGGPKYWDEAWNDYFEKSTLNDKEMWKFLELMKTAYTLREAGEIFYRGGGHVSENPLKILLKFPQEYERINKVLLPAIFKEIDKLLSPEL